MKYEYEEVEVTVGLALFRSKPEAEWSAELYMKGPFDILDGWSEARRSMGYRLWRMMTDVVPVELDSSETEFGEESVKVALTVSIRNSEGGLLALRTLDISGVWDVVVRVDFVDAAVTAIASAFLDCEYADTPIS